MANVLVVDGEVENAESIATELRLLGHHVDVAQDAASAVAKACINKPDILIAEWMLGGSFDGIDLCHLVEAFNPNVKTILLTGYASHDLEALARRAGLFEFLEKPLPIHLLSDSVKRAVFESNSSVTDLEESRFSWIGIMSVADTDRIEFMNSTFQQMVQKLSGTGQEMLISQLFSVYELALLENSGDDWIEVNPLESETRWYIHSRELPGVGRKLWVILDEDHAYWRDSAPVSRLLGHPEPALEVDGHFLMVDDSEMFRTVTQRLLKGLNNVCLTADTHEEAIRLFVRDGAVNFVVLDYLMPDGKAEDIVKVLKMLRPGISIVGTSGDPANRAFFEALGVTKFIKKPWTAAELFAAFELDIRVGKSKLVEGKALQGTEQGASRSN